MAAVTLIIANTKRQVSAGTLPKVVDLSHPVIRCGIRWHNDLRLSLPEAERYH